MFKKIYKVTNKLLAQSPVAGALPEVLAVAGTEAITGAYYGPTQFGDTRGAVGDSRISDAARDKEAAIRLWTLSEELVGISWKFS